ncbi:MAG: nitroreductase [Nanoarchaeota archaeon]
MDAIKNRRSIRRFLDKKVESKDIDVILQAGRWAPSGLNNQPWKFQVLKEEKIKIADLTTSSKIINASSVCIAVFLDKGQGYNRDKDMQGIGACVQTMLLQAYSIGIGSCWLGEILNKKDKFNKILLIPDSLELAAVVALGYPAESPVGNRKDLKELIL